MGIDEVLRRIDVAGRGQACLRADSGDSAKNVLDEIRRRVRAEFVAEDPDAVRAARWRTGTRGERRNGAGDADTQRKCCGPRRELGEHENSFPEAESGP